MDENEIKKKLKDTAAMGGGKRMRGDKMQANQSTESGQLEKLEELTEEMTESDLSSVITKSKENQGSMENLHN